MRIHTTLNALAIMALANLFAACGSAEPQKFPCKNAGEVLTSVGVCATPGDLVPKEKHCAVGMLQQSDDTCVAPETPWVFPCTEGDVLHEDGSCTAPWKYPCAVGNVLQPDGQCTTMTEGDLARLEATSRVYVSQEDEYVEYRDTDGHNMDGTGSFGTGYFAFHAVGEAFMVTSVPVTWFDDGSMAPAGWLLSHAVSYYDEGGEFHTAYVNGYPASQQPVVTRLYVPKDGTADLATSIYVQREVCNSFDGFRTFSVGLELAGLEAIGLTTGKHITLSQRQGEYVQGNRVFVCGSAPDPRLAAPRMGSGSLVKVLTSPSVYYTNGNKRYTFPTQAVWSTWFADFSQVQTVSETDLAAIPFGGNVTARPGSLIKRESTGEVFLVDQCHTVRPFSGTWILDLKFGPAWNQQAKTVPEVWFVDYTLGPVIDQPNQIYLWGLAQRSLGDETHCE